MKSTIFTKVLNEEYIEVNKSVPATISALREISGSSRDTFPENTVISLSCSKKGKIRVSMYRTDITSYKFRARGDNMYPLYYVYGQVISKDNKTYIKANSVFKKSEIYTEIFWAVVAILFIPLYLMYLLGTSPLKIPILLLSLVAGIFISLNSYSPIPMRKSRGITMLPYMVDEIKKRVEIIEQWEEKT
jgi:hypothetical protein